ncbi:MAG: hypothetical protein EA357_07080 [Micavibrio sp.]|nr:MAG: hypothetical protein EA357_07080 [Micavibrio sp.]
MKMLTLDDFREILLHHRDRPDAPDELLGAMLQFLSSVRHTEERGLVVLLELPQGQTAQHPEQVEALQKDATEFLKTILPDLPRVAVIVTAEHPPQTQSAPQPHSHAPQDSKLDLPGIKHIIAVSSGKGGVGKSAVANNLAAAFARQGLVVGLLDADIHGPSQPHMLGTAGQRAMADENRKILPHEAHGFLSMSIGYLMENQGPVVWRGPMVQRALIQMLRDVAWGELDVLLLDLPPGTGDIPLTLAQKVPLSGAVIVSTPQDIALLDAMKGLEMFRKLDIPLLGLIENMSMFSCPHCGEETHLFGHGGARREAEKRGVPFLGEIPLSLEIREAADAGRIAEGESRAAFEKIAQGVMDRLSLDGEKRRAV